jgi:hypothetical protein
VAIQASRWALRHKRWLLAALSALLAAALLVGPVFPALRWIDRQLLNESLKDAWGAVRYREDWATAVELPRQLDDAWLRQARRPVLVAHALGEAGLPGQNTLGALQRSLARNLRLLEIDVWLDADGMLRCHHGPDRPRPFQPGDCSLPAALTSAAAQGAWLVLDIKTDFAATGQAIVQQMTGHPAAFRLVFQLYRPEDAKRFAAWAIQLPLPAPIVTAYLARRSVAHVALHAARIGAAALTVPLDRAVALTSTPSGPALLLHPVHDCDAARRAAGLSAAGMYIRSALAPALAQVCAA